jgi:hypothetical protein
MIHHYRRTFFYCLLLFTSGVFFSGCKKDTGYAKKPKPEVVIGVNDSRLLSNSISFVKDTVYILATDIIRDAGQLLSIEAGTLIRVRQNLSITINPGGKIEANGTAEAPVVFTNAASMGSGQASAHWYGIRIYGNFLTDQSSSGSLRYTRIEFAGADNIGNNILPSLLLSNVTSNTAVENIQVSYSSGNSSFGFYGGNVNAGNLVSYASFASDFYIRDGYKGMLQNILAWRHPYFPDNASVPAASLFEGLAGVLLEGGETFPVISNATVIGPDLQPGTAFYYTNEVYTTARVAALVITAGSKFHIRNSVFMGFPKAALYMGDLASALSLANGESDFTFSIAHSNDPGKVFYLPDHVYPPFTSDDFKAFILEPRFNNEVVLNSSEFMFSDPFNYDNDPNALPKTGSPLLNGANFDAPVFSDPFFKKVNYRGASGSDNRMQGWTNFSPLRTNYNN